MATGGAGPITTSALSQGAHTLTAKATDAAGNQGAASTAFHVTIDTMAPVAPVIVSVTDDVAPVTGAVANNGSSNDTTLTIAGTAEAGSTVTIYDTDGTTVLGTGVATGGAFTITTSVLDEGAHTLTAKASDAAGNQSAASTAFHVTIVCFLSGTMIACPDGERAVETLDVGDLVLTFDGCAVPVKWIGRQTLSPMFGMPEGRWPVCITAGALGNNLPVRDLRLTADHALLIDNVLVQAGALVNGTTVRRIPPSELGKRFVVYHIETENHRGCSGGGCASGDIHRQRLAPSL